MALPDYVSCVFLIEKCSCNDPFVIVYAQFRMRQKKRREKKVSIPFTGIHCASPLSFVAFHFEFFSPLFEQWVSISVTLLSFHGSVRHYFLYQKQKTAHNWRPIEMYSSTFESYAKKRLTQFARLTPLERITILYYSPMT